MANVIEWGAGKMTKIGSTLRAINSDNLAATDGEPLAVPDRAGGLSRALLSEISNLNAADIESNTHVEHHKRYYTVTTIFKFAAPSTNEAVVVTMQDTSPHSGDHSYKFLVQVGETKEDIDADLVFQAVQDKLKSFGSHAIEEFKKALLELKVAGLPARTQTGQGETLSIRNSVGELIVTRVAKSALGKTFYDYSARLTTSFSFGSIGDDETYSFNSPSDAIKRVFGGQAECSISRRIVSQCDEVGGVTSPAPEASTRLSAKSGGKILWDAFFGWMKPQASEPIGESVRYGLYEVLIDGKAAQDLFDSLSGRCPAS